MRNPLSTVAPGEQRARVVDGYVIETSFGRVRSGDVIDIATAELRAMDLAEPGFVLEHFAYPGRLCGDFAPGFGPSDYRRVGDRIEPITRPDGVVPPPARVVYARPRSAR